AAAYRCRHQLAAGRDFALRSSLREDQLKLHCAMVFDREYGGGARLADVVVGEEDVRRANNYHLAAVQYALDVQLDLAGYAVQRQVAADGLRHCLSFRRRADVDGRGQDEGGGGKAAALDGLGA